MGSSVVVLFTGGLVFVVIDEVTAAEGEVIGDAAVEKVIGDAVVEEVVE